MKSAVEFPYPGNGLVNKYGKRKGSYYTFYPMLGLWIETVGPNDFVDAINGRLEPLGFPIQERKFIPHVTLARIKYPQKHTPDVTQFLNTTFAELPMKISRINLMSSQLFSKGAVYTILGTHFLVSKA